MNGPPRIFMTDWSLATKLTAGFWIGTRFVFLDAQKSELNSSSFDVAPDLHSLIKSRYQFTIPLPRSGKLSLPGISLEARELPELSLSSLTVDRDLYRYLTDIVHVLIVDLNHRQEERNIILRLGGIVIDERPALLDEHGVALVHFQELPIGEYEVTFEDYSQSQSCCFRVAAFELAFLVATLRRFSLNNKNLLAQLDVQRFGTPCNADLRVDLIDVEKRIDSQFVSARGGLAFVRLELTWAGPHRLEVYLRGDSTATANVPLPGSRREERDETVLSECGSRYTASMMPGKDSTAVRGLSVARSGEVGSPIWIHEVHRSRVRLESQAEINDCCIALDRLGVGGSFQDGNATVHRYQELVPGEVVEIDIPSPAAILSVGGFVKGKPWECRAVAISPSKVVPKITIATNGNNLSSSEAAGSSPKAGRTVTVRVQTDDSSDGSMALLVKDARLSSSERPEMQLARNLKQVCDAVEAGAVDVQPIESIRSRGARQWRRPSTAPIIPMATLQALIRRQILTTDQVEDVRYLAEEASNDLFATIVARGYAEPASICRGLAEVHGWPYIALDECDIAEDLLLLCPESVARENEVIPVSIKSDGTLIFAFANPYCLETIDKLRFILNRRIDVAVSVPDMIRGAIDYYYSCDQSESADTMLQEFTDTAIDFTDTMEVVFGSGTELPAEEALVPESIHEPSRVLFCDLIPLINGTAEVEVDLPEEPDSYVVDAFIASEGDWGHGHLSFESMADPYVKLQLPENLFRGDTAMGRIVARASSGVMKVEVSRDGIPIPLRINQGHEAKIRDGYFPAKELELVFEVLPGEYQARVTDVKTQNVATSIKRVTLLGELSRLRRVPLLLEPGQNVEAKDEIRQIQLLPNMKPVCLRIAMATANYEHLCCEQTAAKLFASMVSLATASTDLAEHRKALQAAQAGIRRLKMMWKPGQGFSFYIGRPPNKHWGAMATRHLLQVEFLGDSLASNPAAASLLAEIKRLSRDATRVYGIVWPPRSLRNCWEAYAAMCYSTIGNDETAIAVARHQNRERHEKGGVYWRNESAFAAACLLRGTKESDIATALKGANQLFEALGPEQRLYSTLDSAGLIVLMNELSRYAFLKSDGRVTINGQSLSMQEAHEFNGSIESIFAEGEPVLIDQLKWGRADWTRVEQRVPLTVKLTGHKNPTEAFREGSLISLRITLRDGYEPGDLVWIALPPCLSRLEGGGQIRQFSVDLAGSDTAEVNLVATGSSFATWMAPAAQHFLVCVRNMYDEERIGNPGPIAVTVEPMQSTETKQTIPV